MIHIWIDYSPQTLYHKKKLHRETLEVLKLYVVLLCHRWETLTTGFLVLNGILIRDSAFVINACIFMHCAT